MIKKKEIHNPLAPVKKPLKEVALFLLDILYNAVIIIALVVLIRTFLISPFRVIGSSMADTLKNNEFILIDKLSYRLGEPKRGDPIVFLPPITSKYPPKCEEAVTTDAKGDGVLDLKTLSGDKDAFYCHNALVQKLWFCREKAKVGDLAYFLLVGGNSQANGELNWRVANKGAITSEDSKTGQLTIHDLPNQQFLVRIYNAAGPEYYVKRIIGIPGDTIRIDNGRVYLKKTGEADFAEIQETYLNTENRYNTFFKPQTIDEFKVEPGHFFVLGDNRTHSNDSRAWFSPVDETPTPYVDESMISGKVMLVLWPLGNLGFIPGGVLQ
jgi:signal peptidase I